MPKKELTLEDLKKIREAEARKLKGLVKKKKQQTHRKLTEREKVLLDIRRIKQAQSAKQLKSAKRAIGKVGGFIIALAGEGQKKKPRKKKR